MIFPDQCYLLPSIYSIIDPMQLQFAELTCWLFHNFVNLFILIHIANVIVNFLQTGCINEMLFSLLESVFTSVMTISHIMKETLNCDHLH